MNEFEDFKKESELISEVLKNYRGRYSDYFISRFGMIPNIPQSYDNANDIYELLAWLQRAVKQLIDDMANLLLDWNDFQNALDDLLMELIPEILRKYFKSDEFRDLFNSLINTWYNEFLNPVLDEMRNDYNKKISDLRRDTEREIQSLKEKNRQQDETITMLQDKLNLNQSALVKLLRNLNNSGAWTSDSIDDNGLLNGNLSPTRNIATGNINLFGGTQDGDSFIRTNNGATENDLAGGL